MSVHKIRQLQERHFICKVELMVWSDKIDLLALSNSRNEVSLYRLTWQRVWTLPPPSLDFVVRQIAWRPDGIVLAVAYVSNTVKAKESLKGKVILVDVENKEILHTVQVSDDISCLSWLQEKQRHVHDKKMVGTFHDQVEKDDLFSKLLQLCPTLESSSCNIKENLKNTKKVVDQVLLNFLFIGTIDGNLFFSVFGLFSYGVININKYISSSKSEYHTSVVKVEMNSDMTNLFLLVAVGEDELAMETIKAASERPELLNVHVYSQKIEDTNSLSLPTTVENEIHKTIPKVDFAGIPTSVMYEHKRKESFIEEKHLEHELNVKNHNNKLNEKISSKLDCNENDFTKSKMKVIILDSKALSTRCCELHALSLKYGHITSLLDYLLQTMQAIVETWENIHLLEIEAKLSQHSQFLPEGSFSANMAELLLTGVLSEDLELFLLHQINDKSTKKLANSVENSILNIQELVTINLLPVTLMLAYHLAEMKGMATLADRFKALGLLEKTVAQAWSTVGTFLIKSVEVQLVTDETLKKYKAFFQWLYTVILRISDDRIPDNFESSQQDLEFIADCLWDFDNHGIPKKQSFLYHLGQYLIEGDLVNPPKNKLKSQWEKLLEEKFHLQYHSTILKNSTPNSLLQQHGFLVKAIDSVLSASANAFEEMFQFKKIFNITDKVFNRCTMCAAGDHLFLSSLKENSVKIFKCFIENEDVIVKTILLKSKENTLLKCLDNQLYLPEVLSVLCKDEQEEGKCASIAQVNMQLVFENPLNVIDSGNLSDLVVIHSIPDFQASTFSVSGDRKVAGVLSYNKKIIRLFETEPDENEDEGEAI